LNLNSLSKKLINLQKEFKEETENRKIGVERMKNSFYDEMGQLKEVVEREQERRVSSERKVQTMIEEI
jgi:Asp-tRNA(Asn)/Glu-tRNA(Gln) amidotransferase B subunit